VNGMDRTLFVRVRSTLPKCYNGICGQCEPCIEVINDIRARMSEDGLSFEDAFNLVVGKSMSRAYLMKLFG
jgi:hypothetical protein